MPRPTWAAAFGWYFAGVFATVTVWSTFGLLGRAMPGVFGSLATLGTGSVLAALFIARGQSMARRSRIAFVFGVVTPFVLAAIAFACLAYAFAHSDWQF